MGWVWEAPRLRLRLRIGEPGQGSISATCNLGSHPVRGFGGVLEVIMYAWRVLTIHEMTVVTNIIIISLNFHGPALHLCVLDTDIKGFQVFSNSNMLCLLVFK